MKRLNLFSKYKKILTILGSIALISTTIFSFYYINNISNSRIRNYQKKIALLESSVLNDQSLTKVANEAPIGEGSGQAIFISICNTTERANVFHGTGKNISSAWENANKKVMDFITNNIYDPIWVKVDIVSSSRVLKSSNLNKELLASRHEFYRYGISLDQNFQTALLEAELNGAKIYDYDNGKVDLAYLNSYLKSQDKDSIIALPNTYTVFKCLGWLCDENNAVYKLKTDSLNYGRRTEIVDKEYAQELILNSSAFLEDQLKEDGSFIYGIYPRFDNEIENYNIMRHTSTLWSLLCRYQLIPNKILAEEIERGINFMLNSVIYDSEGRAYLYEEKSDEIKLGGGGIAIVALTEYMNVFNNEKYKDICESLGQGILSMMDQNKGTFYHVLNGDFSKKEELRTVYYDGEATFGLCRLYSLTNDLVWLNAAQKAISHFIEADYTQYKDHWVAYSMNEITKHITDNKEYYSFALANAQNNLEEIRKRDTTYHTYLELLMATFEIYDRMIENKISVENFDLKDLLNTISVRVDHQLNGYFYPEYAMYMKNPQRIVNTFMVRHDGYRVRIDDVQHNIGGYFLYVKNYEKLINYGLVNS